MDDQRVELPVPGHEQHTLGVIRHGHYGRPVLVFPSEAGRAEDFGNKGMTDAVADLIDSGRVSFFCVDSADRHTWSDSSLSTEDRAKRHHAYTGWLEQSVLPWMGDQLGGSQPMMTMGVSMGAYHAVHFALTHAHIAPFAMGFSGNYDVSSWHGWGERGDATYFANPTDYVAGMHGDHLDWLRAQVSLLLVVGQGPFEVHPTGALPSSLGFAKLLESKGISHQLDLWGQDVAHDWPWWSKQLAHHLPRFC